MNYDSLEIKYEESNIFISGVLKLSKDESVNLKAVIFKLKAYIIKKSFDEKRLYWNDQGEKTAFNYYYKHFFIDFDLCFGEKRLFINWVNELIPDSNLNLTYEITE